MKNCLIRNNVTFNRSGGGVYVQSAAHEMHNCTVVSNYAGYRGGGLETLYTMQAENCIIYFNDVNAGSAEYDSSNYYVNVSAPKIAPSFSNCCTAPAITVRSIVTNNITADPQFVSKTAGDYNLVRTSPCVNAGVNRDWMAGALDLAGHRRQDVFSGIVDIGCYEYVPRGTMFSGK